MVVDIEGGGGGLTASGTYGSSTSAVAVAVCLCDSCGSGVTRMGGLEPLYLNLSSRRCRCVVDLECDIPSGPQRVQVQGRWPLMVGLSQGAGGEAVIIDHRSSFKLQASTFERCFPPTYEFGSWIPFCFGAVRLHADKACSAEADVEKSWGWGGWQDVRMYRAIHSIDPRLDSCARL